MGYANWISRCVLSCVALAMVACLDPGPAEQQPALAHHAQAVVSGGDVPHTTVAPRVDGEFDADWGAVPARTATRVLRGPPVFASDLSLTWRAMWSVDRLYVFATVEDDQSSQDSHPVPWEDDSLEIYLDADGSGGATYDGVHDFQLVLRPFENSVQVGAQSATNTAGILVRTSGIAGASYNLEVSIPWENLGVTPTSGMRLGIDVHVNDDDDGGARDSKLGTFAVQDDAWTNPSAFGVLHLGERLFETPPSLITAPRAPDLDGFAEQEVWGGFVPRGIANSIGNAGTPSVSASYRLAWDLQALYALVEVSDDDVRSGDSPTSPWEDDSIEIYLDADHSRGTSYDGQNDFQYVFRFDDPVVHVGARSAGTTSGIRFALNRVSGGYTLEAAIPWSTLGVAPTGGTRVGLDVHVNDDDGGGSREHKIAAFAEVDQSWTNPSLFASLVLEGDGGRRCRVDAERELLIRDLSVVEDPVRTAPGGAWTFGRLMEDMAPSPAAAPAMVERLFRTWQVNQTINGFTVEARPSVGPLVLDPWPRTADGQLDLRQSPLRLLAIVNRVDLRDLSKGQAGEGRFVFGLVAPNFFLPEFTLIVEYRLPAASTSDVERWARDWHALSTQPFPSEGFNAALEVLTTRFAGRGAEPGRPNGSALGQLRTNEILLAPRWELREFALTSAGLQPSFVKLTPDDTLRPNDERPENEALLAAFINQNEAAVLAQQHVIPEVFQGRRMVGGRSFNDLNLWNVRGVSPEARHLFSLNTCNGCHGGETTSAFYHVFPRGPGSVSSLSAFMDGRFPVFDPVTGVSRTFNDLGRRVSDLEAIVCVEAPTSVSRRRTPESVSSARQLFLSKGIGRVH